jgi:hypothetical protein
VLTAASRVAARTDRRPVAGGCYDPAVDTTFITWAGRHEDNYVQAYDHRAGAWSAPVKVGDGDGDPHNYPTIVQAGDGHLLVFRGVHNTELVMARSAEKHSIDAGWTRHVVAEGAGATYPMPVRTDNGDILVFLRETVRSLDPAAPPDLRPVTYVRSSDHGRTWHNARQLTGSRWFIAPTGRPDNMNEIYIGQLRHQPAGRRRPEQIHIVYTLAGGGPEGHLHDRYHRNLYYTVFTPQDLRLHAADGGDLGTSVDDATQERRLRIVETPLEMLPPSPSGHLVRSPDYIQLVGTLAGRTPFVVWMRTDTAGVVHDHAAVWTPGGWHVTELGTGIRVRDMEPVGPLTWRVYATRQGTPGIQTYLLRMGRRWRAGSVVATPRPVQRVEVVTGYRDPARIIATGASGARDVAVADGDIYVAGRLRAPSN